MFCRKCGAQILEDSAFCIKCGTKIELEEAKTSDQSERNAVSSESKGIGQLPDESKTSVETNKEIVSGINPSEKKQSNTPITAYIRNKFVMIGIVAIAVLLLIVVTVTITKSHYSKIDTTTTISSEEEFNSNSVALNNEKNESNTFIINNKPGKDTAAGEGEHKGKWWPDGMYVYDGGPEGVRTAFEFAPPDILYCYYKDRDVIEYKYKYIGDQMMAKSDELNKGWEEVHFDYDDESRTLIFTNQYYDRVYFKYTGPGKEHASDVEKQGNKKNSDYLEISDIPDDVYNEIDVFLQNMVKNEFDDRNKTAESQGSGKFEKLVDMQLVGNYIICYKSDYSLIYIYKITATNDRSNGEFEYYWFGSADIVIGENSKISADFDGVKSINDIDAKISFDDQNGYYTYFGTKDLENMKALFKLIGLKRKPEMLSDFIEKE